MARGKVYNAIVDSEEARRALDSIIEMCPGHVLRCKVYRLDSRKFPEELMHEIDIQTEEVERLDPRDIERIQVDIRPPVHVPIIGDVGKELRPCEQIGAATIEPRPESETAAKIQFKYFMSLPEVRGVDPMDWESIFEFHRLVSIFVDGEISSVMELRRLDPEKITSFDIQEVRPRPHIHHRSEVYVTTKKQEE